MLEILVRKSNPLNGNIKISGSKNAALPILAASILSDEKVKIENIPKLTDTKLMVELLNKIGGNVNSRSGRKEISYGNINTDNIPYELVSKIRGSFLLAGPLLARTGKVKISMPGGCPIGTRPIDLHLKGFSALGADIIHNHGYVEISADNLIGNKVYLDFPSVGATENIMMASCMAKGETQIENASAEPEIIALAEFINAMGGNIEGAGTDTIVIAGVDRLGKATTSIIPDRIEGGTYLLAFATTHGKGRIEDISAGQLTPVIAKLREIGVKIDEGDNYVDIDASGSLKCADIKTMPFPGFPTDMQAPFTSLLSVTEGTSLIVETIFENRFLHVGEINRMGAKIKIDGRTAIVEGTDNLMGAVVEGMDLRGGAALVIAGLVAQGETTVHGVEHINRGYDDLVGKLSSIGADIELRK